MTTSPKGIWARLTPSGREAAAADLARIWESIAPWSAEVVARAVNFRPSTVRRSSTERAERLLHQAFPRLPEGLQLNLLQALHIESRPTLLEMAYDALGVPHEGVELEEAAHGQTLDPEVCLGACARLGEDQNTEAVWLCFATMALACPAGWGDAVRAVAASLASSFGTPEVPRVAEGQQEPPAEDAGVALGAPSFSALDRTLIRTAVSTLNNIEGSLGFDELDDLVQEIIELNDTRHQSHFHRGFVDALMDRPAMQRVSADNQSRRAWYLVGHLIGGMRCVSIAETLDQIKKLDQMDRSALLDPHHDAGAMLAPEIIEPLLHSGDLGEAEAWLRFYAKSSQWKMAAVVLKWSDRELLNRGDPSGVRRILQLFSEALRSIPEDEDSEARLRLLRDLDRRRAVALRSEGRQAEAAALLEHLLGTVQEDAERPSLLAQRVLVSLGVRALEALRLPDEAAPRQTFIESLGHHHDQLAEAVTGPTPSPIALYALALPAVADPRAPRAEHEAGADRLRHAIQLMMDGGAPVWERSGLQDQARFGLAVLELRSSEPGAIESAAVSLHQLLREGIAAPGDLVLDAVTDAILRDVPVAADVAELALKRLGHRAISHLDLAGLCLASPGFRGVLINLLEDAEDLNAPELWNSWFAVLQGAAGCQPRDLESSSRALDALEHLSTTPERTDEFIDVLADGGLSDPAWDRSSRAEAKSNVLLRSERTVDAQMALRLLAHEVISDGRMQEGRDLIERAALLGASREDLHSLRSRLAVDDDAGGPIPPSGPVTILFVGGNETQERYRDELVARIKEEAPHAILEFEFSGWGSNWGRLLDHLDDRVYRADAVVIMRFVRTGLGRALRKMASQHDRPWVACSGHGLDSLRRAILEAIDVAARHAARSSAP